VNLLSDNKKYYYLKLKDNFFDSDELIVIQGMNDGHLYSDILIKLYLRSLRNNGKLMLREDIPYTSSILAQIVRHNTGVVEKALRIFKDLGLIEVLDNGIILMVDIGNLVGRGSSEAERKANYRKRNTVDKKLLQGGTKSHNLSLKNTGHFPPEREIEREIDIEIKKEREKEIKEEICFDKSENNSLSSSNDEPLSLDNVNTFFEKAWAIYPKKSGKIKVSEKQKIVLFKLGDEFIRCIKRYINDPDLKINSGWKEVLNGSSFFNSRYIEWTDKEYEKSFSNEIIVKSKADLKKERIINMLEKKGGKTRND